jgi:hypothetical protein
MSYNLKKYLDLEYANENDRSYFLYSGLNKKYYRSLSPC